MQKTTVHIANAVPRSPDFQFESPINWMLKEKEHWAFLGPNGGGKTLLARILKGEIPLKSGEITYNFPDGRPLYEQIRIASFRDLYSLADYQTFYYQQRWNSSEEETPLIGDLLRKEWPEEEIRKIVSVFGVEDLLEKNLILLSSGELRKFLIIRILLSKPKVLILDNPYIGLDEPSRKLFNDLLERLSGSIQLLLLLSDPKDIPVFCTHILPVHFLRRIGKSMTCSEYEGNEKENEELFPKRMEDVSGLIDNPFSKANNPYGDIAVDMKGINIKYGNRYILKELDWTVKKGEKWALLGPNGAGKSTLLSLIYADNPQAYANNFYLFGRKRGSGESIWEIKERIGFVSPEFHLYYKSNQSCLEIVASGFFDYMGQYRKSDESQLKVALQWMELVKIDYLKNKLFSQVSFGEQRIVILLRAFVKNPDLLILDEPLHGLDKESKRLALLLIDKFCTQKN
ncbi:MAG: ATP-binding cassette domain-containing protein, partial [Bacteroidales bacterium]|nr:ATP-binding cassette domain-containing protein [Bacteroidales bacterium]